MTDTHATGRETFADVRAAFERLVTKDKATFVVEAALGTLGEAIESAGRGLSDMVDDLADQAAQPFSDDNQTNDPDEDDEG